MPDITMCSGEGCKKKDECYRFLAQPDQFQSFYTKPPVNKKTGRCSEFWECPSQSVKKRLDTQHEW